MKPAKKVHTSAIVIIPPPSCFPPIQEIRAKYDKSYERWMPHINLFLFISFEKTFYLIIRIIIN